MMAPKMRVIKVPASLYTELESLANNEQEKPADVVARLVQAARLEKQAIPPTRAFQGILQRATDLGVTDLAEQHDHYLYGVDKK